jgi:hypothetical protein
MDNVDTSDGSYKSEDEESDSEFEVKYSVKLEEPVKACEDIVESLKKDIKFLVSNLEVWYYNSLDWGDSFCIFYVAYMLD